MENNFNFTWGLFYTLFFLGFTLLHVNTEKIYISGQTVEPIENEKDVYGPPVSEEEKNLCQTNGALVQLKNYSLIIGRKEVSWKAAHFCCQHIGSTLLPYFDNMETSHFWKYIRGVSREGVANAFWVSLSEADNKAHSWWWLPKVRWYFKDGQSLTDQPANVNGTHRCGILFKIQKLPLLEDRICLEKHKFMCWKKPGIQKIHARYNIIPFYPHEMDKLAIMDKADKHEAQMQEIVPKKAKGPKLFLTLGS